MKHFLNTVLNVILFFTLMSDEVMSCHNVVALQKIFCTLQLMMTILIIEVGYVLRNFTDTKGGKPWEKPF